MHCNYYHSNVCASHNGKINLASFHIPHMFLSPFGIVCSNIINVHHHAMKPSWHRKRKTRFSLLPLKKQKAFINETCGFQDISFTYSYELGLRRRPQSLLHIWYNWELPELDSVCEKWASAAFYSSKHPYSPASPIELMADFFHIDHLLAAAVISCSCRNWKVKKEPQRVAMMATWTTFMLQEQQYLVQTTIK